MGTTSSADDPDIRPYLTARSSDHSPPGLTLLPLGRRALAQHFALKGRQPAVRSAGSPTHSRRVAVNIRVVPHSVRSRRALMAHVRYIERNGAGADNEDVQLFDAGSDRVDGQAFAHCCEADRHHFRITINPEDGRDLPDLKAYGRKVMKGFEQDMNAGIEWVAGIHHDTGRPHLHLVVRGRRADGKELRLSTDYMRLGLRERAEGLATEVLGPRPERAPEHIIRLERYTPLDRMLIQTASNGRLKETDLPPLARSDGLRRLVYLEVKGWATREGPTAWRISDSLRRDLTAAKEATTREIAAARILADSNLKVGPASLVPFEMDMGARQVGMYVGCRFIGPFSGGAHVVVVDLADGRLGHLRMPDTRSVLCLDRIPEGSIVELHGLPRRARSSDQIITKVAAFNQELWSAEIHARTCPEDTPAYVKTLERRIEGLEKEGVCDRVGDRIYRIPGDLPDAALRIDRQRWGSATTFIRVHDDRALNEQIHASGETWLDRVLAAPQAPASSGRFGAQLDDALNSRTLYLEQMGIALPDGRLAPEALHTLGLRQIQETFQSLQSRGKPVFMADPGGTVSGRYVSRIQLRGVPYAVLESRSSVTLVAWKPGLEAVRNQAIQGVVRDAGLEFRSARAIGRGLGLG